ncbi:hypothetical protein BOTBODRAFT_36854 [Botryobasidium botryosum FD-172 SS1]|uniref:F-box/LRR-repeat protein 15/At3g58940/PEG3-like LRR domain-containing protein n=1 Tax=Botryobasidium botryosum (strain FD-172 SS1) TaxID=930990 RepID=A0A067MDC9_BOTB1|nr:hypothetical protein BOTBODRAFT_36854 [Botryobasidium botryosum FD-172 SS1]
MSGLQLPNELISIIIDYLHDDKPTLKICALICRDWIAPSRSHLLRSIRVYQYGVDKFILLCDNPFSTIHYVRAFELAASQKHEKEFYNNTALRKLLTWRSPDGQRTIATALPQLKSLSLCHIGFWILSDEAKEGFAGFRSLRELSMLNVIFESRDQLSALLSLLPQLEILSLTDIQVYHTRGRHSAVALLSKLHTIKMKTTRHMHRGIVDVFTPCRSLRVFHLHVRSFSGSSFACGDEVGRLLASAGPSLKEFSAHAQSLLWSDGDVDDTSIRFQPIDLTQNTCLQRISLDIRDGHIPFLRQLADATRLSPSFTPTLQSLEIKYLPQLTINWGAFDHLLQLPYFAELSELKYYIHVSPTERGMMDADEKAGDGTVRREAEVFAARLPRCKARGILCPVESTSG